MSKKHLVSLVAVGTALLLIGAGCTNEPAAPQQTPADTQPTAQSTQTPSANNEDASAPTPTAADTNTGNTAAPTAAPATDTVKEFTMTAKNWAFEPSTITVNKGDKVRIKITSVDVEHGFALPDFNVDVDLQPGQTQTVEFVADKTGTFSFRCSIPCGEGHREMRGVLIVK